MRTAYLVGAVLGAVLCLLAPSPSPAATADARVIPYQGTLELDGLPAQGPHLITAKLYGDAFAVSPLWQDDYTVQVEAGRFFVLLGGPDASPLPEVVYVVDELQLELEVNGQALIGRQRIFALPFATNAARATALEVHESLVVFHGAAPLLELHQDDTQGNTPQAWRLEVDTGGAFLLVSETQQRVPFRVAPAAPWNSLGLGGQGKVGMGVFPAETGLHLRRDDGDSKLLIEEASATTEVRTLLELRNNGRPRIWFNDTDLGNVWAVSGGGSFVINNTGDAGNDLTLDLNGDLTILGSLTTGGPTCGAGCDRVFSDDYELESIDAHARAMWQGRHLPAVGPTSTDTPMNVSDKVGGLLNELEKAHIYIEQLHRRLEAKEAELAALRAQDERFEARLARLEARAPL